MFGGETSDSLHSTIARLDSTTFTWTKVGDLNKGRYGHNAIEILGRGLKLEFLNVKNN